MFAGGVFGDGVAAGGRGVRCTCSAICILAECPYVMYTYITSCTPARVASIQAEGRVMGGGGGELHEPVYFLESGLLLLLLPFSFVLVIAIA